MKLSLPFTRPAPTPTPTLVPRTPAWWPVAQASLRAWHSQVQSRYLAVAARTKVMAAALADRTLDKRVAKRFQLLDEAELRAIEAEIAALENHAQRLATLAGIPLDTAVLFGAQGNAATTDKS